MDATQRDIIRQGTWSRRRFGPVAGGLVASLLAVARGEEARARKGKHRDTLAKATLEPVDDSDAGGFTILRQLKKEEGTAILVLATGLEPGTEYLSLYYDNDTCELEPYSEDDVIGEYTANAAGIGHTRGTADDDLDEIGSVSVRLAEDFSLVACAKV